MRSRLLLTLLCFLLIIAPAHAVCNWDREDTAAYPGIADCTGTLDSGQWPRLPTDTEIASAKEVYLAWLQQEGDSTRRIDDATVVKFHYCEGGNWQNHVDTRVAYSWWWQSTTGEGEWQSGETDTFLIYTPGSRTFEFVATSVPSMFWFSPSSYTQGFATGPCSGGSGAATVTQGGNANPPADEAEFPWVVVIGALGALGAAGLVGAKVLGGKKGSAATTPPVMIKKPAPSGEKTEKEESKQGEVSYILQISPTDTINVGTKKPGSFSATVWKVNAGGTPALAGNAVISLTVPAQAPGLSVTPGSGMGSVTVNVSLEQPAGIDRTKIKVNASVGGKGISAFVTVNFDAETKIEFE